MLLDLQIPQAGSELVGCEGTLGSEVDQAFLLDVQLLEFLLQTSPLLGLVREHPFKGVLDFTLGLGDAVGGEDDCPKLLLERALEFGSRKVRQVAEAVLTAAAEEVLVDLACMVLGFDEDEAMFSACRVASPAMEQATREVVVNAVALSSLHASIDHLLDPVEQLRRDERFMASRIHVALEGHHADVVRIAQNLPQLTPRQRTLRPLRGLPSREPLLREECSQSSGAVVTCRVLLERPADQRRASFVDGDCVHESTVEVFAIVEVAELGAADGAATFCFVEQLLLDVLPALADLDLVHDVGHGFHRFRHVSVAEIFLRGDEFDAHACEDAFRDCGVASVSESARAHVNDDVRHLRVLLDVAQ